MDNYIFIGPPGSGKGTQAKIFAQKINGYYFGMGDAMREEAEKKSEIGLKFQKVWDKKDGSLAQPELVDMFFLLKLKDLPKDKPIIIDGYPRSIAQAESFYNIMPSQDIKVININVDVDELIKRMSTRKVCENCEKVFSEEDLKTITKCDKCGCKLITRQEDQPDVIRKRIDVYNEETLPLTNFFRKKNIVIDVDGNPPIKEVASEIWKKTNAK